MEKRRIAHTTMEVSRIGLGTVKFGRNSGVKYPTEFALPSDQDIANLLALAKDLGINLLDTAPAYGSSEERLGELLQGQRQDWIIATKAGEEFMNGESHFDFSPMGITRSVERSLKRLHTDYLDIVLIHSNGDDVRLIEEEYVFTTLAALKKSGKIRAFGMSSKTIAGGLLTVDCADIAMVSFNSRYQEERDVLAYAKQKQKSIFVKKAFGSGHLSPSISLPMVLQEPGVTSVITGTINPNHLRENVDLLMEDLIAV